MLNLCIRKLPKRTVVGWVVGAVSGLFKALTGEPTTVLNETGNPLFLNILLVNNVDIFFQHCFAS